MFLCFALQIKKEYYISKTSPYYIDSLFESFYHQEFIKNCQKFTNADKKNRNKFYAARHVCFF